MDLVNRILAIYIWGVVCILLFFLFAIARFYEQKSGCRSFYSSFLMPIVLFAAAAIRYTFLPPTVFGDVWGDLMRFVASVIVGGFGFFLLRLMMGGRS